MNKKKLNQLFAAARNEPPASPPAEFASDVLRAVRREPPLRLAPARSIWEHLNALFPRLALAAAAVIVLCAAADWGLTVAGVPGVGDATQAAAAFTLDSGDL